MASPETPRGPARVALGGDDLSRDRTLTFTFDGRRLQGLAGDTIASALLANGIHFVGRSFKYHRPRGIYSAGFEEPNAIVDVTLDGIHRVNLRATMEPLADGMTVAPVNADPSLRLDRRGFYDALHRFIPAGFYYKVFHWPQWEFWRGPIRRAAGLGRARPAQTSRPALRRHGRCDLLVVGAGPAGLAAAATAAEAGLTVMLVEEAAKVGGSLRWRHATIDGHGGGTWAETQVARIRAAGGVVLTATTAFSVWAHGVVGLMERLTEAGRTLPDGLAPERLWLVEAGHILNACGAIERPLVFANNDRPGIMTAGAGLAYLRRHGVRVGHAVTIATNNDTVAEAAIALTQAGARVEVIDRRVKASPAMAALSAGHGIRVHHGCVPLDARGRHALQAVRWGTVAVEGHPDARSGEWLDSDCLLVSGGWTPTVHLHSQLGGKLIWDEALQGFVPGQVLGPITTIGAAHGAMDLAAALAAGHAAGRARAEAAGLTPPDRAPLAETPAIDFQPEAAWPKPGAKGRAWVDLQNDVTTKDIALAKRESFQPVEHLKRYTTLGMATDQGKTSNLNGLALMAQLLGKPIAEVGTTTFRPPFVPVSLEALAGPEKGLLYRPVRRLVLEDRHRARGAILREYGGWLRPAAFGDHTQEAALIQAEALHARTGLGLADGSSLGKIEVLGRDAARFLDFIFYNTVSTLAPGRARYGFMLTEKGIVYDDGVLLRMAADRFIVSASSSHVAGVTLLLEEWRQDSFPTADVAVINTTAHWATLSLTGARAPALLREMGVEADLSDAALPHMAVTEARFQGQTVRVARISFTGERGYEVSLPAGLAGAFFDRAMDLGRPLGLRQIGLEASSLLRAEKGYILVGKDTDGTTMPHDLGFTQPRLKKQTEFVGRRSLLTPEGSRPDRRQLVGLEPVAGGAPLAVGAHLVADAPGSASGRRSIGFVTSSYHSPLLGRAIALGLVERGAERHGEILELSHLGTYQSVRVVAPVFVDPEGQRLHATV